MNKIKRISIFASMALLGIGILLLGAWDMHHAAAASVLDTWYQAANAPNPIAFYGFAQCPEEPDVFYALGSYPGETFFYSYDASVNEWTTLPSFPIPIERSGVVCYAGYIYAAGGDSPTKAVMDTLYIYDIPNQIWTQAANMPHPLKQAAIGIWDGKIYLAGGTLISLPWTPIDHVDIYDIATDTWTDQGGEPMPVASSSAGYAQVGQYLYVVGGWSGDFNNNVDATLLYDMSTDTWEDGPEFTSARAAFSLVATESHLYASGGDADGGNQVNPTDLVEVLDLSIWPNGAWVDISDPLSLLIEGNAGFCSESVNGGEIWSIGGTDGVNLLASAYYRPSEPCFNWPPQVLEMNPAPNTHNAGIDTPVAITYDMDMDPATVVPGSFAVHARQTGWLTETLSVDGGTITLQPTNSLHAGELVQVTATTATLSMDGEAPVEPTVWEFTTAPWNGIAEFSEHQILENADGRFASLGDLDGDNDLDAITVSCHGMTRVYFNDGSGTFTEVQSFDHALYCLTDVNLGDLDGDGDLDAFLANYDPPGSSYFLINAGAGNFTISAQTLPSEYAGSAELGDLDGDGDLDLFIASGGFYTGGLEVWKNDGLGNFTLASEFGTAYERTGLALGDLDNDGDLDAFTAGWYNTYNEVWLNDGRGAFALAQSTPNANTYYPLLGDLNGDDYLDAYLSNMTAETIYPDEVWLNDGIGHFTDSGQRLDTVDSIIPALGDLDADGDLDVYISGSFFVNNPDEVWTNDGLGNFTLFSTTVENDPGGIATLADVDSDGDLDAFVTSIYADFGYQIYLNTAWMQVEPPSLPSAVLGYGYAQCLDEPNHFYIFGGRTSDLGYTDEVWRFDAAEDTWTELAPMYKPVLAPAAVCDQGNIYVAGGADTNTIYGLFGIYNIATDSWTFGPDLPNPVFSAAIGGWDGKVYLVGGAINGDPWPPTDLVQIYDITTQTWSETPGTPMPFPAAGAGYVQTGSYLWIVGGGYGSNDYANRDTTQRYDMANDTWTVRNDFTSQRALFALAATSEHLYSIGGDVNLGWVFEPTDLVETLDLQSWPNASWESLHDPLPQPIVYNTAGICSEVLTGGEVWSVAGATGAMPTPTVLGDALYRHAEPCVSFGVDLPAPWIDENKVEAGTMVEYWLTITNTGVVTDYYTLEVSTTWGIGSILGGPGPIGPGDSMLIAIDVEIPIDALPGDQGVTEITAASISNPAAFDITIINTTVGLRDFDLQTIPPDSQEDHPGNVLTYTLVVSNSGDFKDSYNVEISATWETTASLSVGPLLPGEDFELVVVVTIPEDAEAGDWDYAVITLSSQVKPLISHSTKLTTTAVWHRMLMPLAMKN